MSNIFRKNQKTLLTIFAAGLMVVFIVPTLFQGGGMTNPVVGHIGDEEIRAEVTQSAGRDWDWLNRDVMVRTPDFSTGRLQYHLMPLAEGGYIGAHYQAIQSNPNMFALLLLEAQRLGVQVSPDQLQSVLLNNIWVRTTGTQSTPYSQMPDSREKDSVRHAVHSYLLINNAVERALDVVKISRAERHHAMAVYDQEISANIVDFPANAFRAQVPAPTPQQLQQQFDQYANVPPHTPTESNPLGFGYQYPNRLRIQYLTLPIDRVKAHVEKEKNNYAWQVEASKIYQKHPERFATTQPGPLGESPVRIAGVEALAVKAGTTTRPFEEVFGEIKESLIKPEVERYVGRIESKINATMEKDWVRYAQAHPAATRPAANAATSRPADDTAFTDIQYLRQIAQSIGKEFGVELNVDSTGTLESIPQITARPGIGSIDQLAQTLQTAASFVPADQRDKSGLLHLFEPTGSMQGADGSIYFMRISQAAPAAPPPNLAAVQAQVKADWITAQAYQMALDHARQLMKSAQAGKDLRAAATAAGLEVVYSGEFSHNPRATIPNYPVPESARQSFLDEAFKLLTDASSPDHLHPTRLIRLPQAKKVVVAQLQNVTPQWPADQYDTVYNQAGRFVAIPAMQKLVSDWFDYDSLTRRLNWKPQEQTNQPQNPGTPLQQRQPLTGL